MGVPFIEKAEWKGEGTGLWGGGGVNGESGFGLTKYYGLT